MVKKLTSDDWDKIQKEAPSRYFVQSVADGKLRVTFDSEIVCVDRGDEDLLGHVWQHEWAKNEAKVFINGEPKIYSMGGSGWSFIREFITACRKNEVSPDDIPGSVFDITKTGDWTQEIEYIGKASDDKKAPVKKQEIKIDENIIRDVMDTIKDLKINSPELLDGGIKKPDFLKVILIRGKVKTTETESLLPELEKKGVLKIDDNRITVL